MMPSDAVLNIAGQIRTDLAGSALSPLQAKLYSQRVRLDMGADGLPSFSPAELAARLDEACLLLDAAWLERSVDNGSAWTSAVKRAAEVLEWVSHSSLKPADAPIHLLSAAAYQVAGYPAMALGHLRMMPADEAFSTILREFLRGDFDSALTAVQTFWKVQHDLDEDRALLRYLGTLFLDRVRLVVIDEAHMVEQDPNRSDAVTDGTSRALRLEQLSARLLRAQDNKNFRIIALSAVAAKAAPAIASWLSSDENSSPISSTYRSTRQMLGRLEVARSGRFDIRYDLMDGRTLEFEDERTDDRPYIPSPFPPVPGGVDSALGVEKSLRGPTLWAALHLAAERSDGTRPTVMISLTQNVSSFAENCADLLESWIAAKVALPNYWSVADGDPHWQSCLAAAEDYFTTASFEYRLLVQGIAVHHGQMPGLLARRLKVAIDRGNVRVVIATSTLSEGVNIPVNTLLIPSVHRSNTVFTVNEFSNLIGRAGRPGVATEGNALVVLPEREYRGRSRNYVWNRTWEGYDKLVDELKGATELASTGDLSVEEGRHLRS